MEQFKVIQKEPDILRIGKFQITEGLIKQIKDLLKSRGMIKVKILKAAFNEDSEKNEIIAQVLKETKSYLLDYRGNIFIISSKPIKTLSISKKCKEIIELSKKV